MVGFLNQWKDVVLSDIIIFTTYPVTPVVTPLILSIVWLLPILLPRTTENNKILEATVAAFSSSLFSRHHEAFCKGFRTTSTSLLCLVLIKFQLILSVVILLVAKDFAGVRGQDVEEDPATGLGEDTTTTTTTATSVRTQGCPYFFLCTAQNIPVLGGIFRKK